MRNTTTCVLASRPNSAFLRVLCVSALSSGGGAAVPARHSVGIPGKFTPTRSAGFMVVMRVDKSTSGLSMNRSTDRQVLDCASPLALSNFTSHRKAAEDCRPSSVAERWSSLLHLALLRRVDSPRRCRDVSRPSRSMVVMRATRVASGLSMNLTGPRLCPPFDQAQRRDISRALQDFHGVALDGPLRLVPQTEHSRGPPPSAHGRPLDFTIPSPSIPL
jgi:hypothetical protein